MTRRSIKCALASISLGLMIGFMAANFRATGASAAAVGPSSLRLAVQQGEDKPVEQTRKNIQVLKGLPSSQLFSLMNFVGASLGVKCDYCHVKSGKDAEGFDNWIWESDDKETKRTARRMMQMVLSVNNTNRADFRDNAVTCYTCHRGQTEPVGLPTLPLAVSAHEDGTAPASVRTTAATTATLPAAEQVMNKYVEALGGRAAVAKVRSTVLKGTFEQSQGRNPAIEINIKEPDKYLIVVTTKQQGIIYQATNGATGWVKNSRGQQDLSGSDLDRLRQATKLYNIIKVAEPFTGMTVTGKEKIGEREAYVVERGAANGRTEKFFFDVENGLLLRRVVLTPSVLFPVPEQTDYEDYREVDGVKLPFTIRTSNIDTFFSVTRRFTEIKHNVPIDDARFNPPPATPATAPQKP